MANQAFRQALQDYDAVRDRYIHALEDKGVRFAEPGVDDQRCAQLQDKLRQRGVVFRNAGASLQSGWLSPACVACTDNVGSETFSTTFRCHRDCYFCFNHNQAGYDEFVSEGCPWQEGLDDAVKRYGEDGLTCIGLTGGEPLLALDDSLAFLKRARQLFPSAHTRLYTSGDLLTEEGAKALHDAGLQEIRFSVKDFDPEPLQNRVLENMELAKRYIPDVVVEMPIIPGTEDVMHHLFDRFAAIGIRGINMLEFCFPFHNWEEYEKRGFVVRNPPYPIMYDYGYSGGLPISGSEELILKLMLYGLDRQVPFGMHYCSLENKHRSEMRQKNERGASAHPCFTFDDGDMFLKAAKVFGDDRTEARHILQQAGCTDFLKDEEEQSFLFPLAYRPVLADHGIPTATSFNILETQDGSTFFMEVGLKPDDQSSGQ